jgi:sugar/nucleoside kinase (ribokinase family)
LACDTGEEFQIKANSTLEVKDVTGAGDAYWAGFLTAYLRNQSPIEAAKIGQAFAEIKISQVGPVRSVPTWENLLNHAEKVEHLSISTVPI